jgi:hypothetical protein
MENDTTEPAVRRKIPFEPLFRWFFSWRVLRRFVAGFAVLVTLIALFYAEEDWRGKRAWEKYKHEMEAKGAVLDWAAYIPPPVPDDQNIFKAPRMTEWFVGRGFCDLAKRLGVTSTNGPGPARRAARIKVGEIILVPPGASMDGTDAVWQPGDAVSRLAVRKCLEAAAGPMAMEGSYFIFITKSPDQIKPARIFLKSNMGRRPMVVASELNRELAAMARDEPAQPHAVPPNLNQFEVQIAGTNLLILCHSTSPYDYCGADDYLSWSDQFKPDFDLIREALKRPYARLDGDYEQAFSMPFPNFFTVRIVAQTLAGRAVCYLLLGQPDKALNEMTLLHNLSRLLEAKPTGKPMTLVAAMINVTMTGIYTWTVAEGFRLHAWGEPQIVELQRQLGEINLLPQVAESFRTEQVSFVHTLMTASPSALANVNLKLIGGTTNWWAWLKDPMPRFIGLAPRGWIYQNMITHARWDQMMNYGADLADGQIHPDRSNRMADEISATIARHPFYAYLAARAIPNYTAAVRMLAYQQTRANEALIACALERCHLANGQYPETPTALVPQFLDKIPRDLIGGQPLKYRLADKGGFILYSVGWNETDDGGAAMVNWDFSNGDWVWLQSQPK